MSRKSTYIAVLLVFCAVSIVAAQSLHVSKNLFTAGKSLQGVFYLNQTSATTAYYRLSLVDNKGNVLVHGYLNPKKSHISFNLDLPASLETNTYLLLAQNVRFPKDVVIKPILVQGEEEASSAPLPINLWKSRYEALEMEQLTTNFANDSVTISFSIPDGVENASISVTDSLQELRQLPVKYFTSTKQNTIGYSQFAITGTIQNLDLSSEKETTVYLVSRKPSLEITSISVDQTGQFIIRESELINREDLYLQIVASDSIYSPIVTSTSFIPNYYKMDLSWDVKPLDSLHLKNVVRLGAIADRIDVLYPGITPMPSTDFDFSALLDPDSQFDLDDYVDMPSTIQMFREIISNVFVRKSKIRVFSPEKRSSLSGPVLKLINGAIATDQQILSLNPEDIRSVGVVHSERRLIPFLGLAPGGIVSITTHEGLVPRYLGTKLPTFTTNYHQVKPLARKTGSDMPYLPDQLYWVNQKKPSANTMTIRFRKPSYETKLFLNAFIQTKEGDLFRYEETIPTH